MNYRYKFSFLIKSITYVFTINAATTVLMLFYANDVINDITSLIVQFAILTVSAPLYFFIKGDINRPWLYTAVSGISHIVFGISRILLLDAVYNGWERAMFYWTEIFVLVFFIGILLLDVAVLTWNIIMSKHPKHK